MFFVVLFLTSVSGESEPTTTKTYDIEVPGSNPIRIIEGEPLWQTTARTNFKNRAFGAKNEDTDGDHLHQFLTTYSDTVKRNRINNQNVKEEYRLDEEPSHRGDNPEKSLNWDLMNYQKHNHPYDDSKGWVSMEPVPWSVSKISKWESKYKPNAKPNSKPNPKPWENDYDTVETQTRPSWNKPTNYDIYYLDQKPSPSKPIFTKPTAIYNQKVHVDYNKKYHNHDDNCRYASHPKHEDGDGEIITDGLPPNFPQAYEANRRKGTDFHPDTHPLMGEGDWVLLSTTKGYKYPPNKQRSLQINPESIGAHRGVRLTVLPPLKNSKVNMTTSHGGLLQVESTFQTVEQAHKQYSKKEKLRRKRPQQSKPNRQKLTPTLTTTKRNTGPDSSTVLAAVGAGMIPATMAMLLPVALGRRRRKREVDHVTNTPTLQITLPRNLY